MSAQLSFTQLRSILSFLCGYRLRSEASGIFAVVLSRTLGSTCVSTGLHRRRQMSPTAGYKRGGTFASFDNPTAKMPETWSLELGALRLSCLSMFEFVVDTIMPRIPWVLARKGVLSIALI